MLQVVARGIDAVNLLLKTVVNAVCFGLKSKGNGIGFFDFAGKQAIDLVYVRG